MMSRRILFSLSVVLFSIAGTHSVRANSAAPFPVEVSQPDGSKIMLFLRGNEKLNWYEYVPEATNVPRNFQLQPQDAVLASMPGYTVVRDAGGQYVYAALDANGNWVATGQVVGRDDPQGARRIMPPRETIERMLVQRLPEPNIPSRSAAPVGTVKNLVILMRFADHANRVLPPKAQFEQLFNAASPVPGIAPTGSVNAFYKENSYGQLDLQSTVIDWITLPRTEAYYANGQSGLSFRVREAIVDALNIVASRNLVDLDDFDNENGGQGDGWIDAITFVHSGYAAEFGGTAGGARQKDRIWSHRWVISPWTDPATGVKVSDYNINPGIWGISGNSIGRIGVICHELGHFFGLPDLYDYSGTGEGIGSWGLMANSWGFDGSQLHPPHMSAWSKLALSWNTAKVIASPGSYALEATTSPAATIYRINYPSGSPDEYLLIENRQPVGEFDGGIPAGIGGSGGLAIWHIDNAMPENDRPGYPGSSGYPGSHYKVGLIQADGKWDLERGINRGDANDLFRAGHVDAISSTTSPSSSSFSGAEIEPISNISASGSEMSFTYGTPPPIAEDVVLAGQVNVRVPTSHAVNFSADGKAATLLLDQLESSVFADDVADTQSATFILPLKQMANATKATIHIRGYYSADAGAAGHLMLSTGAEVEVVAPSKFAVSVAADGSSRRTFAAKMQRGMPPRPSSSTGADFVFETSHEFGGEDRLAISIILHTNKKESGDEGAYLVVDSIDVELSP
jgi:M6 family metalloprotease-like protein